MTTSGSKTREYLDRIKEYSHLQAFLYVDWNLEGSGPVIAVKDNIDVAGMRTTAGSIMLPKKIKSHDAAVISLLRKSGCQFVGKTLLHEFALGATGENSHFGTTKNPHDPSRIAGGSSSGSAAAVGASLCDAALGTDTGGSVRLPAAFCGVVGFKPRRASLPRRGIFPVSKTFDAVGVLARSVSEVANIFSMATGKKRIARLPARKSLRLGVPKDWLAGIEQSVLDQFETVTHGLRNVPLPSRSEICRVAGRVSLCEAASIHLHSLEKTPDLYGDDVRALLLRGLAVRGADYLSDLRRLKQLKTLMRKTCADVDAILLPTAPCVAPRLGSDALEARDKMSGWTRPFNVSDSAVVTIPVQASGLPIGIQIVSRDDWMALGIAELMEQELASSNHGASSKPKSGVLIGSVTDGGV